MISIYFMQWVNREKNGSFRDQQGKCVAWEKVLPGVFLKEKLTVYNCWNIVIFSDESLITLGENQSV